MNLQQKHVEPMKQVLNNIKLSQSLNLKSDIDSVNVLSQVIR